MKHLLAILTVVLAGAAMTASAAPLFDDPVFNSFTVEETPYDNEFFQGNGAGSYYTVKLTGSGTFYLSSLRNSNFGEQNEFLTHSRYGITQYGYIDSNNVIHPFDITDSNNIVEFTSVSDAGFTVTREGYRLGDFKAGDEIQIYLAGTIGDNEVWAATNSPQSGIYSSRFGGRTDTSNSTMPVGQLYFGDKDSSQMNFGIVASAAGLTPGNPNGGTFGSPLPGGLQIAIIAGLFGLGLYYFRRRKAVAA